MSKKGIVFFFFVRDWANYINQTIIVKDQVPWADLPGYETIVKAFLLELKFRLI